MNKIIPTVFFYLIILLLAVPASGQSRKKKKTKSLFGAGAILGINASQVDGDNVEGYKKNGVYGGVRGIIHFSPQSQLDIELVYSQKGSKWGFKDFAFDILNGGKLKMNYMEVPFLFKNYFRKGGGVAFFWKGGFSYGRAIKIQLKEDSNQPKFQKQFDTIADDIKSDEFNVIAELGYQFENKMSFGLRTTWGINRIFQTEGEALEVGGIDGVKVMRLRNYYLTVYAAYDLRLSN